MKSCSLLEEGAQSYEIDEVFNHPMYTTNLMNDIALIKTVKPIVFNKHVQPVCLTADDTQFTAHNFSRAFNIGWDIHSAAIYPRQQQVPLNTMYYHQFPMILVGVQVGAINNTWSENAANQMIFMQDAAPPRPQVMEPLHGKKLWKMIAVFSWFDDSKFKCTDLSLPISKN
uniref:Peptidase S1 domain-containing protein n=1 Tax=Ditylenchus dipsaci TaxID=166011 RepID=A0A915ENG4_9BILA